jgi:hypothetical protein
MTGGDGNKTIDSITWTLANSATLTAAAINDGTHTGLYMRANTTSSNNASANLTGGALYVPLGNLSAVLAKPQVATEIWVWVSYELPHTPNLSGEVFMPSVFSGTPYTAAGIMRISLQSGYDSALYCGQTQLTIAGATSSYIGKTASSQGVYAFKITPSYIESYYGNLSSGNFPAKTDLILSGRTLYSSTSLSIYTTWYLDFIINSTNTTGATDGLVKKLYVEYK